MVADAAKTGTKFVHLPVEDVTSFIIK
jgi:hypothetical protein